ncbi:MAG: polysaccharide deacetylase family protein [Segniliparus sp.]|uniref:polysaccharide deacetylase family protein n=1 Tax=Segniliparus sp. TaxID=2804064 RepID=UPI003F2D4706
MAAMERRRFLQALAASAAVLGSVTGGTDLALDDILPGEERTPRASAKPLRSAPVVGAPFGVITRLPESAGSRLAWTVDDGCSVPVVAAFAQFLKDTGIRMTFFPNGANASWTACAPALRPMVESGQVALGNHTWSHPDVTKISASDVADQIVRNEKFLKNTYGVTGRPFFRPPFGKRTAATDRIAADNGYRVIALWSGTLGDSTVAGAQSPDRLEAAARREFQPRGVVLSHANLPGVTHCYPQLVELIKSRGLQTVTLQDVFGAG